MNVEENRLHTFDEWPNNAVVTPQRIARAGFFATKQGTEVECFLCHLKISNWNYGDQAMARHRALNPQCPFVVNPSTSGNVPIISPFLTIPSSSQLNYKDEETRLLTFENWPSANIVTPERLARAGFYFLKREDNTKCAFCQGIVRAWEAGDDPDNEHKRLFPTCPFVTNSSTSGNVPIMPPISTFPSSSEVTDDLTYTAEEARLFTFENWPSSDIVAPERLARAGFYYLRKGDDTKCAYCQGVVRAWEAGDDPDNEHRRLFPSCPFVVTVINPRLNVDNSRSNNPSDNLQNVPNVNLVNDIDGNLDELGVQKHRGPKRSNFATLEARIRSFVSWPTDLIQTPDILAQAGFYYEGMGDQVRCFHCDGGLRHWDPHDDPWTEHARWFPNCSFVKLVKGQEFVTACALENSPDSSEVEVYAILMAVSEEEVRYGEEEHIYVCSDSQAALKAVCSPCITCELVRECASALVSVPGHRGIPGNERADEQRELIVKSGQPAKDQRNCAVALVDLVPLNVMYATLSGNTEFLRSKGIEKIQSSRGRREISDRELQEHMTSPAVIAALNIGINVERVKRAVKQKILQTGRSYSEPDALVEAALNLQLEEDDNFEMECHSSIRNQVRREIGFVLHDITKQTEAVKDRTQSSATAAKSDGANSSGHMDGLLDTSSKTPSLEKSVSLEEENRILKEARLCKICMDGEVGIVFLPCGHLATCVNCAPNLEDCPVCRSEIKATVRTFLS